MYGCLFKNEQEAAFSNKTFWKSLGQVLSFAYATTLTTTEKLYILAAFASSGFILYLICEFIQYKNTKQQQQDDHSTKSEEL